MSPMIPDRTCPEMVFVKVLAGQVFFGWGPLESQPLALEFGTSMRSFTKGMT